MRIGLQQVVRDESDPGTWFSASGEAVPPADSGPPPADLTANQIWAPVFNGHEVVAGWQTMGRGDGDFMVPQVFAQISRRHCAFERTGDEILIIDLDSRNGTFLNDMRVTTPQRVVPGDIIRLGVGNGRQIYYRVVELV